MTPSKTLPTWFVPLMEYSQGVRAVKPPHPQPAPQYFLLEKKKFENWMKWVDAGRPQPRPRTFWKSPPAWTWVIRKAILKTRPQQQLAHAYSPTDSRLPTKGRKGLYFYNEINAPGFILDAVRQHNWWVALLVHEKGNIVEGLHNHQSVRDDLQKAGITVVASGWIEGDDPETETSVAALASIGFNEYMANAENPFFGYSSGGAAFARSSAWAPRFRSKTNIPISLSVEWGEAIHLKPWLEIEKGLVVRPQCYMNQFAHMTPASAVNLLGMPQADSSGLRPDQVEPTLGKWGGYDVPISFYFDAWQQAKLAGAVACNVWGGEFMDGADLYEFATF